jgi:hypothetical protein
MDACVFECVHACVREGSLFAGVLNRCTHEGRGDCACLYQIRSQFNRQKRRCTHVNTYDNPIHMAGKTKGRTGHDVTQIHQTLSTASAKGAKLTPNANGTQPFIQY